MKVVIWKVICLILALGLTLAACAPAGGTSVAANKPLNVLAVETFLADIAQNVAGDRLKVDALLPFGVDPHGFEPVPSDIVRVAKSTVLIVNGAGLEVFLDRMLKNAGGQRMIIVASQGLKQRVPQPGEGGAGAAQAEGDPHFWLDPNNVIVYVQNIRDGLSKADPDGAATYAANAEAYIKKLRDLDTWIRTQVSTIPEKNRLLVTNHESQGYFADRYGFTVVGTILSNVSSSASPSAQDMVQLVARIRATGAKAIFLETGANPQLARQLAQEAGVKVVETLYDHSITNGPPAGSYIDMMRYNVTVIVDALK